MKSDKRAILCMPGYGNLSPAAARGFWQASDTPSQVYFRYNEGSLLAQNFNAMWCTALNMLVSGEGPDYFAMQHADVGPEDFWLDKLIDEMESRDLDVLGVVIPIKDANGLTSIALDKPGNQWHPLCRLTMQEIYRLPETFTGDDVGHQLLLNTGLWVCRFDPSWVKRNVHFTINDRIVFDKSRKRFIAETEPEDWNFSRQCHRLGLKIGATRKIRAVHRGDVEYTNERPWGRMQFDSQWIGESVIHDDGFRFPHDVEGWLTYAEGRMLFELAKGKRVLEIGSYCGRSTICLAQSAKRVVSIDPHDGRGTPAPRNTFDMMDQNLDSYGVGDAVVMHACTCSEFANDLDSKPEQFDLIFIDGSHDYESVQGDIADALPFLADDGLIAFHDYREYPGQHDGGWDPGVTEAVNEFIDGGAELLSTHDSLAVVRPPVGIFQEV